MKDSARPTLTNAREGLWNARAKLALPCVLAIFTLGGVTTQPHWHVDELEGELARARERAEAFEIAREEFAEHAACLAQERSQAAIAALRAQIPEEIPSVVAHGSVRWAAEQAGVAVTRMEVTSDVDLGLPVNDTRIVARMVSVGGQARAVELERMLTELDALGLPGVFLELSLRRSDVDDPSFEFTAQLALFHHAPLLVEGDDRQSDSSEDQP